MNIDQESLIQLIDVWKGNNYTLVGHPSSMTGQAYRCVECGQDRDIEDYNEFKHSPACPIRDNEKRAKELEKSLGM